MTSGTGEGKGSPDPADGLDYYIPPFFPNVLETRGQGARGGGVSSDTRSTASITILILSSYVCRLEPLAQGKSSLFIFCLILALIYFVYRYHDFSVPETFCPEVRGGVLRSHNGPHRILRSRYVV